MLEALKGFDVIRVRAGQRLPDVDQAAAEEPLEVRLHDRPFAVIMRTPGADRELAAGFLLAEQVIRSADELGTIEHCKDKVRLKPPALSGVEGDTTTDVPLKQLALSEREERARVEGENVVNVTLAGPAAARLEQLLADRRQVAVNASCGMCGRQTIDSLRADRAPLSASASIRGSVVALLPDQLRAAQAAFDVSGGLHAAGLFSFSGALEALAEDVGRHNAVDKVIGRMLMLDMLPLADRLLFVSGRTSFEIVQKAFLAGIPVVAAVSAPSSLAIELARDAGITLIGFVRGDSFNIYSHAQRIS